MIFITTRQENINNNTMGTKRILYQGVQLSKEIKELECKKFKKDMEKEVMSKRQKKNKVTRRSVKINNCYILIFTILIMYFQKGSI